jgi:heptosyltransferase II
MTTTWPLEKPTNILVRMPNWLGDLVMATPILKDLRTAYPNASITAMCQTNVCALIKHDPHINEIFCFKKPNGWVHRRHHLDIIEPLRQGKYDLGVLLTNSFSSAWWLFRGRVQNRIGFSDHFRNLLLNQAVSYPENKETQHLVYTYKVLLKPLGIPVLESDPQLYLHNSELTAAKELLERCRIDTAKHTIIGINPGAAYGSAKCWLPDRFEAVSRRLLENPDHRILFFGDPGSAKLVDSICSHLPEQVINLAGKTSLRELMALIKLCSVFLNNDSGPMHIAAALKTPLVAIFGSTSDVKTGPFRHGTVIHKHADCSPCYKRVCPIDHRCMKRIEVEEVYQELMKKLEFREQTTSI